MSTRPTSPPGAPGAEAVLLVRLTGDRRHAQVVAFPPGTWVAERSTTLEGAFGADGRSGVLGRVGGSLGMPVAPAPGGIALLAVLLLGLDLRRQVSLGTDPGDDDPAGSGPAAPTRRPCGECPHGRPRLPRS